MVLIAAIAAELAKASPARTGPPPAVERALRVASHRYGVPYWQMRSVSWCESRWNPRAVGSGSLGLFQFLPSTFAHTPYRRMSIFDPTANALAAAWLVRHDGGWREWTCRP